jgi:methionine synthase I (cobalamin-dependent)
LPELGKITAAGGPEKDPAGKHHKKEIKAILERAVRLARRLPDKLQEETLKKIYTIAEQAGGCLQMIPLNNLDQKKELDEMVFHLKGVVEAAQEITAQMQLLDATIDDDLDRATDAMGALEAEIYTHLAYHTKELRKPFSRLFRSLCRELDKQEKARARDLTPET